ncbi:hypothetical protein OIU76_014152 [Salix suchowensis]|nr:hypothetical protein OIU78_001690 [Salix suchowensis]KAJ6318736.1 hypothetical protein OIU76_014152 [Salix suchowensis]
MQGFGILAGGMVAAIISVAFKAQFPGPAFEVDPSGSTLLEADHAWRNPNVHRFILLPRHFCNQWKARPFFSGFNCCLVRAWLGKSIWTWRILFSAEGTFDLDLS